ncbi:MAG: hypothetical protein GY811_11005 [Myxococcales bacterium]|nr:hypothetical protein [Myxococcales bacterium]
MSRLNSLAAASLLVGASLLASAFVASCSSPRGLDTFPTRDIDRPYTLPADVNTWSMPTITAFRPAHDGVESEFLPPIPLPIFYSISLTETLTLDAALIPSSLRYQAYRGDDHLIGIAAGVGLPSYSSVRGGLVLPLHTSVFHRVHLAKWIALETSAGASLLIRTDDREGWRGSATTGPRLQLTDRLSFRPSAAAGVGKADSVFVSDDDDGVEPLINTGAHIGWNLHSRWRLALDYVLFGLLDDHLTHTGAFTVTLYW